MNKHEKSNYSVGIVGHGFVGKAMKYLFPEALVYDNNPTLASHSQEEINRCEIVFVCVPTNAQPDGSVDLTAVNSVLSWLNGPIIVIKSTVPAEAVTGISQQARGEVVFNPEFLTEKHWQRDVDNETRIILGSESRGAMKKVARTYQQVCRQEIAYHFTDPKTAMLVKYAGNAFLAVKVAFANQLFDVCEALELDYDVVRELWLTDTRVGRSHTLVTDTRGFGGYCLPKDLAGLLTTAKEQGITLPVLESVQAYNQAIRKEK